jgi:hypothetical protein
MTEHPLTDEICKQIVEDNVHCHPDSPLLDLTEKTCMRASYDMGREKGRAEKFEEAQAFVEDFLDKFAWRYSWQATHEVRAFVKNFEICMRPQQQEDK